MSIWNINENKRNIKEIDSNKVVDILIIGAGITGLSTAYHLMYNKSMCIVDAGEIGKGVTLNSTAKISYLQESLYSKIASTTGVDNAVKYLNSQRYAIEELVNLIRKEKIDCDLERVPSYIFASKEEDMDVLDSEVKFLKKNNINIEASQIPMDIKSYGCYRVNDTYVFNPIKYLNGLYDILTKNNINIYENTKITKIKKIKDHYVCFSGQYTITAKKIVLASHYPYFLKPFFTPIRCSLEKSYMIVSKVKEYKKISCISIDKPTYSVRYYKNGNNSYQISLAKSNDLNKNENDIKNFDNVKNIFNLKDEDIIMKYTNTDIITPDHMPYIGKLKNNMYIGIGYNTWGMSNGFLASLIISDLILNRPNKYELFNPNRINNEIMLKIPYYIFSNTISFIESKLIKNKKWYSNRVKFFYKNGKSLASYKDDNGKKHIVVNKCPHLKCGLVFNEVEKTWDCPCHSSRFTIDGERIKGPANYDIKYKK